MKNAENRSELPNIPTNPDDLFEIFANLGLSYTLHHHERAFTVSESDGLKAHIPGTHCRNLFLRDKKGKMFLVTAANDTEIDLKKLQIPLDCGRLSFGSADRLMTYLGIYPGAVCPFTVINDEACEVSVVLDKVMMESDLICVHPLDNAMTVSMPPVDLLKFFAHTGHTPQILDMGDIAADV